MTRIPFSFDSQYGKFSDCLVFPDDQTFTEEELTAMKEQRFQTWLSFVQESSEAE